MKAPKNFSRQLTYALVGVTTLMGGCKLPNQPPTSPSGQCFTEDFPRSTAAAPALDLLFVADTSASLEDEKGRIAEGIDSFIGHLPQSTDLQIAVMPAHGSLGEYTGRLYTFHNNPIVLSTKSLSIDRIQSYLRDNLMHAPSDYYADGGEEGLFSINQSVTVASKLNAIHNQGFFRSNASLAVVFISDENDICARYPAGVKKVPDPEGLEEIAFKRDCANVTPQSVYAALKSMQGNRPMVISGVLHTDPNMPPKPNSQDEYGWGYMDIIKMDSGFAVDIDKGDYSQGFAQIADLISSKMQPTVDFKLSKSPVDPSTIVSTLVGTSCSCGYDNCQKNGWIVWCDHRGVGPYSIPVSPLPINTGISTLALNPTSPSSPTPSCSGGGHDGDHDGDDHDHDGDDHDHDHGWGDHDWDDHNHHHCTQTYLTVQHTFDATTNVVHLVNVDGDTQPTAEIQYCLVQPSPSPSVTPSPSPTGCPIGAVCPSPSPSVKPSPSPSVTPSPSPSPTGCAVGIVCPSPSPSVKPSPSPTVTPSPSPSPTGCTTGIVCPSPSPSVKPSPSPTVTPSPSPTVQPSPSPSVTVTPSPSPSPSPTVQPSPSPTVTPSPSPSPTVTPSPSPSVTVTPSPSPSPDPSPTPSPSASPSPDPSPTPSVTVTPTPSPSVTVTPSPSPSPSVTVTPTPSPSPTCSGPFCGGGITGT